MMLRSAASKAMSVGRFASAVFGLALVLALMFGVVSVALAANGQPFLLGRATNAATALTKLTANVDGAAMQVQNTNAGTDDTALSLAVQPGEAPMRVNSESKVANLNADKLDGKDSADFLGVNGKARDASNADFASFAGEAQNAQGADKVDGKDSTAFFSGKNYSIGLLGDGQGGGSSKNLEVICDPGDSVLGGGGGSLDDADHLSRSIPQSLGEDGWFITVKDNNSPSRLFVDAVCADFPPLR